VQVLNCYLEPDNEPFKAERAKRVTDIVKDIMKQDAEVAIVVYGDFNNHIHHMFREMHFLNFTLAYDKHTTTHKMSGHLDQIFARGVGITNAVMNVGFDIGVTDHKCLKVSLKLK
jgi:hypothetical protein